MSESQKIITQRTEIEQLVESIPSEIRTALKMLSDDTRLAIVLTLLKDGQKSFSELSDALGIQRNILSHHLKALSQAALVRNYYRKIDGTEDYSFYDTTNLSRDFIDRMFGVMEPVKSSADALADIYFACKMQAVGTAKLAEALHNYSANAVLDSIVLVKSDIMNLNFAPLSTKAMLREELK